MSLEFKAGQLVKMGKFKDAIPLFYDELYQAIEAGVTNPSEFLNLSEDFSRVLLNPSDFDHVQRLGDKMLSLAMRVPGSMPKITKEEFYANIKLNYDTFNTDD